MGRRLVQRVANDVRRRGRHAGGGVVVVVDGREQCSAGSGAGRETRPSCRCRRRGRNEGRQNAGGPVGKAGTILRIPRLGSQSPLSVGSVLSH